MMLGESAERIHPPTMAKRERILAGGHGPRAAWLASFLGVVLFAGLSAVAAPPRIDALVEMTRRIFQLSPSANPRQLLAEAMAPALWLVALALGAALLAHAAAHGAWIRMGPWKRRARTSVISRIGPLGAGIAAAIMALLASVALAWPWLANMPNWGTGSLSHVAWSALGMIGMTSLGAAAVLFVASLIQRFAARSKFESSIRLTRAEAREAARESGEGSATRGRSRRSRERRP